MNICKIKTFLGITLVVFTNAMLYAQQIATAGVIDIARISSTFPREAGGHADLQALKKQYQDEIDEEVDKLEVLKREKLLALKNEDYKEADKLDQKITRMISYIDALSARRQSDLLRRSKSPIAKNFLKTLQDAISFVAEEKGYTLIFKSNADGLQWWAPVVDITDDVITRIKETL